MDLFRIVTKYTNELTEKDKKNYYNIFCNVFNTKEHIEMEFKKKYEKNIYGASLIIFCYIEEQCVAIQSFLRNDLNGQMAFQSGDSATLPEYRGKGIFSSLVIAGINELPNEAIIYGFPNENSLPIFKKLGWCIGNIRKTGLFYGNAKHTVENIDDEYLSWMLNDSAMCPYFYCKWRDKYLLLKRKKLNIYQVIGITDIVLSNFKINTGAYIRKAHAPILFIHCEGGKLGKGMTPITFREKDLSKVLFHKLDVYLVTS